MTRQDRIINCFGFSLLEVVIATGIFAAAIVAVIGLMGPMTRRAGDVIDSEVAARMSASIEDELKRIGFADAISLFDTISEIEFVANTDASRVRLALPDGTGSADNDLDDVTVPGIANRDRYFRIRLTQHPVYDPATSNTLALRADVEWPYWIAEGPASVDASEVSTDTHAEVPEAQRQRMSYFFALRP